MNTRTITHVKPYIKLSPLLLLLVSIQSHAEWTVDFSRHSSPSSAQDLREPASVSAEMPMDAAAQPAIQAPPKSGGFFDSLFQSGDVAQEIVVLNTEKGFVPATLRVKKGLSYQIHVVNVNEKEKNVSFVLDSFSEHHATYYGKIKSFTIRPQKEGVYKFVSPETSAQGKLVVFPANSSAGPESRLPASAE